METKTAKITSVQENQRQYTGKNGLTHIHLIKFEGDENSWEYHSLKAQCEKFKLNEVQTFDIDVQQNGQYTNRKIKPKQEPGAGFKKEPKDQGIITYLSCLSSAANYFANTKPSDWEDVMKAADKAFNEAFKKSTLNK